MFPNTWLFGYVCKLRGRIRWPRRFVSLRNSKIIVFAYNPKDNNTRLGLLWEAASCESRNNVFLENRLQKNRHGHTAMKKHNAMNSPRLRTELKMHEKHAQTRKGGYRFFTKINMPEAAYLRCVRKLETESRRHPLPKGLISMGWPC